MAKPEMELFDTTYLPWRQVEGAPEGVMEQILSHDPETGSYTRILRSPPAENNEILVHDFWEEVYVLEGCQIDKSSGEKSKAGYYCCRPPGMKHGPYSYPWGVTTLEIRTYVK